jgi:hypothetical protein
MNTYRLKVSGKKFFPCVFVQFDSKLNNEFLINVQHVETKQVKDITQNYNFPLISYKNNKHSNFVSDVLDSILNQIEKDKNDDFPYNLIFRDNIKLIYCLKYTSYLRKIVEGIFFFTILLAILDLNFVISTQDFSNNVMIT